MERINCMKIWNGRMLEVGFGEGGSHLCLWGRERGQQEALRSGLWVALQLSI